MSERERWIVYPLIFFALGAAVRDKLLQRVEAKEIVCETLTIVDLQNPHIPLAELAYHEQPSSDPNRQSVRMGILQLVDSQGNIVCQLKDDGFVERLQARRLQVVDPHNHALVHIATEPTPVTTKLEEGAPDAIAHEGVIYLNNEPLATGMRLAVPKRPLKPEGENAPAEKDSK